MTFLLYIILYVSEVQPPVIHWIDILTAIWIISYTFRDIGTGKLYKRIILTEANFIILILTLILINIVIILFSAIFLWKLEDGKPIRDRRFLKRYLTFWHMYNLFADFCFLIGLLLKLLEILIKDMWLKWSLDEHSITLINL